MQLSVSSPGNALMLLLLVFACGASAPAASASRPVCQMTNTLYTSVSAALFLPRNDRLVLDGGYWLGPGELSFCETTTLKPMRVCKDHKLSIWSLAASPDGKHLATGGGFGEVKVYDADSGKAWPTSTLAANTQRPWLSRMTAAGWPMAPAVRSRPGTCGH